MKVGEMVVRAYAWPSFEPGVVMEEHRETVTTSEHDDAVHEISYEQVSYTVYWSSGAVSSEMCEELLHLEEAYEMGWNDASR